MMGDNPCLIWVGSELGYLKSVDPCKNIIKNYGEGNEEGKVNAPNTLTWSDLNEEGIFCGTKSGQIRTFAPGQGTFNENYLDCGKYPIVGIAVYNRKTLACNSKGAVTVWDGDDKILDKEIGDNICTLKQNSNYLALGGKENNLKLFDIDNIEKPVFTAKNVRNDSLDLQQPVWITAIDFINREHNKIIVGTGYHKIQIYDTRKQRRPINELLWEDYPITSMSLEPNGHNLIVGNTTGSLASFDLRKMQKIGNFKGFKGSISSVKCHQTQGFVACSSIDRWLRVYDIKTRVLLQSMYLKSRLSCILLSEHSYGDEIFGKAASSGSSDFKSKDAKEFENPDADDTIWNEMESVTDKAVVKSRRKKKGEKIEKENLKKMKTSSD